MDDDVNKIIDSSGTFVHRRRGSCHRLYVSYHLIIILGRLTRQRWNW